MDHKEMVLYTHSRSLRSWRAKRLLRRSGYQFEVVDTTDHPEVRAELLEVLHREVALPYVFVDHRPVGDFGVIKTLSHSDELAHLLRDDIWNLVAAWPSHQLKSRGILTPVAPALLRAHPL